MDFFELSRLDVVLFCGCIDRLCSFRSKVVYSHVSIRSMCAIINIPDDPNGHVCIPADIFGDLSFANSFQ
ncbi:hypothetical protein LguiB_013685 [Lonicera macranthoides]